eukprot:jgi/Tetstr1/449246/TSEL_036451.t1
MVAVRFFVESAKSFFNYEKYLYDSLPYENAMALRRCERDKSDYISSGTCPLYIGDVQTQSPGSGGSGVSNKHPVLAQQDIRKSILHGIFIVYGVFSLFAGNMALAPNGDMYWCQVDNNTFEVYKSTDGGGTWAFYLLQRGHTERQFPAAVISDSLNDNGNLTTKAIIFDSDNLPILTTGHRPDVYDHRTLVGDGSIVLDWAVAPSAKGIVVMFHGLAASSMGKKNMIRLCRRLKSAGFTAVVYNRSGHAPGTTPRPRGIRQGRN